MRQARPLRCLALSAGGWPVAASSAQPSAEGRTGGSVVRVPLASCARQIGPRKMALFSICFPVEDIEQMTSRRDGLGRLTPLSGGRCQP